MCLYLLSLHSKYRYFFVQFLIGFNESLIALCVYKDHDHDKWVPLYLLYFNSYLENVTEHLLRVAILGRRSTIFSCDSGSTDAIIFFFFGAFLPLCGVEILLWFLRHSEILLKDDAHAQFVWYALCLMFYVEVVFDWEISRERKREEEGVCAR